MGEISQGFESDRISSRQVLHELQCGHLHVQHRQGLPES